MIYIYLKNNFKNYLIFLFFFPSSLTIGGDFGDWDSPPYSITSYLSLFLTQSFSLNLLYNDSSNTGSNFL